MAITKSSQDFILEYKPLNDKIDSLSVDRGNCGYKLYTEKDKWVFPWKTVKIPINAKLWLPGRALGLLIPEESTYNKFEIFTKTIPACCSEPFVAVKSSGILPRKIKAGTCIAEMIILPYIECYTLVSDTSSNRKNF